MDWAVIASSAVAPPSPVTTYVPLRIALPAFACQCAGAVQISPSPAAVGTAVFAGMIVASTVGVFLIPMLYESFQTWRERLKRGRAG